MTMFLIAVLCAVSVLGFGFLVPVAAYRQRDVCTVAGMTMLLGTSMTLVGANALSYLVSVHVAFIVMVVAMGIADVFLLVRFLASHDSLFRDPAERTILLFLGGFALLCGFMGARYIGSDPWSWQHFPLAATIVAGNFPVMTPIDPLQPLRYHYAPAFLAAGFRLLTGYPLSVGFSLQPLFGAAGTLFFSAAIVRRQKVLVRTTVLCAVLALAGGGLTWLKGSDLLGILRFLIGHGDAHSLQGLWNLVSSPITTSPLIFLGHRSTALGFPLLFGLMWCMSVLMGNDSKAGKLPFFAGFIFSLALALAMEMAFVTVSATAAVTAALLLLFPETRSSGKRLTLFGFAVLLPAFLVALVQGGVLSGLFADGGHKFIFHPSFVLTFDSYGSTTVLWSVQFLRDFGLPLLLSPLALVGSARRFKTQPIWMFLCILGIIHFLLPFLVQYQLIKGEMHRAFYVTTSIFSLLAGFTVTDLFLVSPHSSVRLLGRSFLVALLFPGLLYIALRIIIPTGRLEPGPLFAGMLPVTEEQAKLHEWVRHNTSLTDYFYVRNLTVNFEEVSDEEAQMRDRVVFMAYTGRFTIGPIIFWDYPADWVKDVGIAETTCSADAMRRLHVTYLLVPDAGRATWFHTLCRPSDWLLRYDGAAALRTFPRIYELQKTETIR